MTPAEYEHFKSSLSDNKNLDFKLTINPTTKETIIPTGNTTNLLNVFVYVKGTFKNPVITKVVRLNSNDLNDVEIIRSDILDNESRGSKDTLANVKDVYGKEYFISVEKQDMPTFQELKRERERNLRSKNIENSPNIAERRRNNGKSNGTEAGLDNSAFSNGEKYSLDIELDGETLDGEVYDILSMGILLDTQVSQKNTGHKKGSTQFMHYLYTPISVNGAPFVAKLCIEEYGFNESKRAYNLQRLKISKVSRAQYSQLIDENRGKYAYTSDALSVAQLFEFVKQKDKKFKPNPVNQVLLNEDGTPKVFYHGTRENFTEFSKKKAKPEFYGRGFYFTTEKAQSNVYGESMEVFLRIENPLMPSGNKITLNQIVRFLEAIAENEDYFIENYGTYDINEIASRITNRDVFSVIQDINATAIGDFGEAMQLFNVVNGTNFDGVITPTETVVYDNTQIKSATDNIGTFDKSDPNIRYSLDIDTSKMTASEFVKSLREKYHAQFDVILWL